MPKVSVIVPNYNHARFLRERLESIYNQTFQDFEVILMDDASTDGSLEILCEYATRPHTRLVVNRRNSKCVFKQWNKGVTLARGEYIWIAESDDFADPSLLAALVPVLHRNPGATLAFCHSWEVDREGAVKGLYDYCYKRTGNAERWSADFVAKGTDEIRKYLFRVNTLPNASAVLFRRAVLIRAGGAVEKYAMSGDWATWIRLLQQGDIAYLARPLNYFRCHSHTVRAKTTRQLQGIAEAYSILRFVRKRVSIPPDMTDGALFDLFNQVCAKVHKAETDISRRQLLRTLSYALCVDNNFYHRLQKSDVLATHFPIMFQWYSFLAGARVVEHRLARAFSMRAAR